MPPPFWELEQAISFSAGFLFDKISKTKGLGGNSPRVRRVRMGRPWEPV